MRKFNKVIVNIKNIEVMAKNEMVKIPGGRYTSLEENVEGSRLTFM